MSDNNLFKKYFEVLQNKSVVFKGQKLIVQIPLDWLNENIASISQTTVETFGLFEGYIFDDADKNDRILMKVFVWFGAISAALFVAHPITREIIIPMSYHGMVWTGIIIYLISSIALAWLFKYIFRYIPKPKLK